MARFFYLYGLWWLGVGHRLRHDFARELTFAVASCVLVATFFYIFNDFLNIQVAELSAPMHRRFAELASGVLLAVSAACAGAWIRREHLAAAGVRQMAKHLGEDQAVVRAWAWLHALTLVGLTHGLSWWVSYRWLTQWSLPAAVGCELGLLAVTALLVRLPAASEPGLRRDAPLDKARSLTMTLYLWRMQQLVHRNRASQMALALGSLFFLLVIWTAGRGLPLFIVAASALVAGYGAAAALCFQLADDLPSAWPERGAGVTHDHFVRTYTWLGATLGMAAAACAGICGLAGGLTIQLALKVASVAVVPGLIAPLLSLQIDGRRSGTNLLLLLIAALFIGTAVFAHWLGLALIPILGSFALKSQAGRFYRA